MSFPTRPFTARGGKPPSVASRIRSRVSGILLCGLALPLVFGCHHQPAVPAISPAAEPVNVGYGTRSKEQIGGAVQSATAEELESVKAGRFEEMLAARVPGVNVRRTPGGGVSIRIRGASRLSADQEPLYVVDGVPVQSSPGRGLDWLDPADIARIDVLKNATETSMYGGRGANGVILITTKRPG